MTPVDPGPLTLERTVTEEIPATLYGCRWVILRGTELPPPMTPERGREDWWYPLRLARDGRVISMAGLPQPDEETARDWADGDISGLAEDEGDYFRRTGRNPEPLEPGTVSFRGVPWEPRVAV